MRPVDATWQERVDGLSDIVTIGDCTLYHADCMDMLLTLPKVELVLTDPPYGECTRPSNGIRNFDYGAADIETHDIEFICKILHLGDSVYCFCGPSQLSKIFVNLKNNGYSVRNGFWEKTNPVPTNGQHIWLSGIENCVYGKRAGAYFAPSCKLPIWRYPITANQVHPTQKPVALMEELIQASTKPSQTVADFFMGSGTTGVACVNLGRKFIGIERERKYFDIACERIQRATNQGKLFAT